MIRQCTVLVIKHVSDGYKQFIQSIRSLSYLPSALAVLKPGSLRPVRFGNTFIISMAIDREYHAVIAQ